jgi:hypothetical protein
MESFIRQRYDKEKFFLFRNILSHFHFILQELFLDFDVESSENCSSIISTCFVDNPISFSRSILYHFHASIVHKNKINLLENYVKHRVKSFYNIIFIFFVQIMLNFPGDKVYDLLKNTFFHISYHEKFT